jgi:hypothetical protein
MPILLAHARMQLYTCKAVLTGRVTGDETLQEICMLALEAAFFVAKRNSFYNSSIHHLCPVEQPPVSFKPGDDSTLAL